jgi:plastocyanin
VQTTLPPDAESGSSPAPTPRPAGSDLPPGGTTLGAGAVGVVLAVLALILATVALVFLRDDGPSGSTGGSDAGSTTVDLTEFALAPAALTVPIGGSLEVTNTGSAAHNLTVSDTDLATDDLAAGESDTLDLSTDSSRCPTGCSARSSSAT